ncbi:MAG: S9 family peptidase [Candidatus Marinimicrobia bacterium]|nr:S9 family peptidase [Candidatus Neomarinimicrobiota bacterium]
MDKVKLVSGAIALIIVSCTPISESTPQMNELDPYIWLEEVEGESALNWVRAENDLTLNELHTDPRFEQFESEALAIYEAKDRLVYGKIRGDYIYNFWRDDVHIRGIWRRSLLAVYLDNNPEWDVLLDIDALADAENENWVYKGTSGLPPAYNRFLIELSRGGKDAVVVREFDISSRSFVDDGFTVPEQKSSVSWINQDQVFVAADFGPGSMTESGYPSSIRVWNRGEDLNTSTEIARMPVESVGLWGWTIFTTATNYSLISKSKDFWTHIILLLDEDMGTRTVGLPPDADLKGVWKNQVFAILRSKWEGSPKGSLISLDLSSNEKADVFIPNTKSSIMDVNFCSTHLLLTIQEDVVDKVLRGVKNENMWVIEDLNLPKGGTLSIYGADPLNANFFYTYNDLITPTTLGYYSGATADPMLVQQSPPRFDSNNLEVNQKFATSQDGTKIPYFLVSRKDMLLDGSNPTLLYGYGGFEVSEKSQYWSKTGKLWMEKGGVFALANIRGGGEYGPAWHQAALKTNRHKSYEDFFAIAEDMINSGITSPGKLGIMGGSGGGLLVGVAFTMRPDLFGAVVSQVPLLDMMRYHKLLAGASWMGEYGDPDDPVEGAYLKAHSPYHLLDPQKTYPRAMFTTSTKDDRVHPGHARKMVARMKQQGHPVMYYENIEGGHAAGANLKQYATLAAIEYTYLHRQLGLAQ